MVWSVIMIAPLARWKCTRSRQHWLEGCGLQRHCSSAWSTTDSSGHKRKKRRDKHHRDREQNRIQCALMMTQSIRFETEEEWEPHFHWMELSSSSSNTPIALHVSLLHRRNKMSSKTVQIVLPESVQQTCCFSALDCALLLQPSRWNSHSRTWPDRYHHQ